MRSPAVQPKAAAYGYVGILKKGQGMFLQYRVVELGCLGGFLKAVERATATGGVRRVASVLPADLFAYLHTYIHTCIHIHTYIHTTADMHVGIYKHI